MGSSNPSQPCASLEFIYGLRALWFASEVADINREPSCAADWTILQCMSREGCKLVYGFETSAGCHLSSLLSTIRLAVSLLS